MIKYLHIVISCFITATIFTPAIAQTPDGKPVDGRSTNSEAVDKETVDLKLHSLLKTYCFQCHGDGENSGDVTLDTLAMQGPELSAESWASVRDVINAGDMPPEDELQITAEHREQLISGLSGLLQKASESQVTESPALRKLTRDQYTHSLQNLLGLSVDFGDVLPEDGRSKMGFSNNAEVLQTTSLHFDYYEKIARSALNKALVTGPQPPSTRFRIRFGAGIEADQSATTGKEISGYQAIAIQKEDFTVEMLDSDGNLRRATDEAQEREFTKFRNNIGIGMRGSAPDRFQIVDDGMLLYSAVPHREQVPKAWQGPSPNLKVLVQSDFTRSGDFRMMVRAARSQSWSGSAPREGIITLRDQVAAPPNDKTIRLSADECESPGEMELQDGKWLVPTDVAGKAFAKFSFTLPETGLYQLDFVHPYVDADLMPSFEIRIDKKLKLQERLQLPVDQKDVDEITTPVTLLSLKRGDHRMLIGGRFFTGFKEVRITPLDKDSPIAIKLRSEAAKNQGKFATKRPSIAAFAGARTDDGMDYLQFGKIQSIDADMEETQALEFYGRLENLPLPVFEAESRDTLSNISIFGIWNNFLVKRVKDSGPPVLIKTIEIELPWNPIWPPKSHTMIFPNAEAPEVADQDRYTQEVLEKFITRAFRRPIQQRELDRYLEFWKSIRKDFPIYEDGIKEVLVAVLCSPNFFYMIEPEASADLPPSDVADHTLVELDQFLLASKLAYFMWNSPPDETLLTLARQGKLKDELAAQTDRMIEDPKVWRMIRAFAWEWLRVDRHENIQINPTQYSDFSRFVKSDMTEETWQFLHHVLKHDLPISNLIDSNFAMLNQNLAEFYGIEGVEGNEFRPVAITDQQHRGGLLSQGAFLSGHSDGQQAHPIKRAVWLKEKILGDPPPSAPPNVPDLDPETPGFAKLTLKEQLELHRNKPSCVNCHRKIDPYGVVFQNFDAVGRFHFKENGKRIDAASTLPDGTKIDGIAEMKRYILSELSHEFCRSLVEHLLAYGLGRDIKYADNAEVEKIVRRVERGGGGFRSVFRAIVLSPSFSGIQQD